MLLASRGLLPTTTSTDCKASGAATYSTASGRHSGTTLTDVVVRGLMMPNTVGHGIGGKRLSPHFVEWMMNFPIGWTEIGLIEFTRSAMPLYLQRQREPFSLSGTDFTTKHSVRFGGDR